MKPGQFPARPLWWEIAYAGGETVRGLTLGEWLAAPRDGVLTVRQPMQETYTDGEGVEYHYTVRCHTEDYYWLDVDGFIQQGNATEAVEADVDGRIPAAAIKRGMWAERDEYRAAFEALGEDIRNRDYVKD